MDVNPGGGGGYHPNYPPQYPHQRQSWFGRNWIWFVPLTLLIIGSPFLCCGGCGYFALRMVKAPFDQCVKQLNQAESVTDRLGTPILKSDSSFLMGNFQTVNNNGHAELSPFKISGPDGRATVSGRMVLEDGVWSIDKIKVKFEDGTELNLPEE